MPCCNKPMSYESRVVLHWIFWVDPSVQVKSASKSSFGPAAAGNMNSLSDVTFMLTHAKLSTMAHRNPSRRAIN